MEFIVLLVILIIISLTARYIFDVDIKKFKNISEDEELNKLTQKYPENIEICKECLTKLKNENIKIEENKDSNTTLYLVASNKIYIANLKNSFTRIQTIAHECLHSVQSKKLLWFNFIFSNVYLLYFVIVSILGIFKIVHNKMLFLSIFLILGLIYYAVRMYLENDAMIKAKFLAKEYMEEKKISSKEEISKIINKYEQLNNLGIKYINFNFINNVILKAIILTIIFIVR